MCKWCLRGCGKCVYHCWFGCGVPTCRFYGFCKWPHGCCYSVMAIFSAFASLYMNFTVIMSCFYQQITEINPVTGELIMESRRGYGMLGRQISYGEEPDYQQCIYYPDDERHVLDDSWMRGSTYSAYACAVLQVIACVVLSLTCCVAFNRVTFERWLMWTYIYASCCMALTFLMFGAHFCKENDCDVDNGSALAISSWLFLITSANMVKNMGQPPPADMVDPDDDEDNLWYDDDADRFPQRYDDGYDEFGYEEESSFDEEDEFAYDDGEGNAGVEMRDTDFLDDPQTNGGMVPASKSSDPDTHYNQQEPTAKDGLMVSHPNPSNPYEQYGQVPSPQVAPVAGTTGNVAPTTSAGGMVPHPNPDDPYAQYSQQSPHMGGLVPVSDPNDPYAQTGVAPRVGDTDGPQLI